MEFSEKGFNPNQFRSGIGDDLIFGFRDRTCHGGLFLRTPGNEIAVEIHKKASCGATIKRVTSPIGVVVCCE